MRFPHVLKLERLTCIIVVLTISILTNHVGALVLPEGHALSLSSPNTTMHGLSAGNGPPTCTTKMAWTLAGQGPEQAACADFLNQYQTAIEPFQLKAFEFVDAEARSDAEMYTVQTPRKLTWSKYHEPWMRFLDQCSGCY